MSVCISVYRYIYICTPMHLDLWPTPTHTHPHTHIRNRLHQLRRAGVVGRGHRHQARPGRQCGLPPHRLHAGAALVRCDFFFPSWHQDCAPVSWFDPITYTTTRRPPNTPLPFFHRYQNQPTTQTPFVLQVIPHPLRPHEGPLVLVGRHDRGRRPPPTR